MLITTIDIVRRYRRPLFAAYTVWVLFLTLAPLPAATGRAPWWFDKVVHFGIFGGMAALLYLNLSQERRHHAIWVVGTAALFAGAIELAQSPLAFRSGDWWDFAWGAVGAAVGWLGAEWVERTVKVA
jgi:glycopeptide antibiotics resistance protein